MKLTTAVISITLALIVGFLVGRNRTAKVAAPAPTQTDPMSVWGGPQGPARKQ